FREKGVISNQFPTVPTDAYRSGNFAAAMGRGTITGSPKDVTGQTALDGQIFDPNTQIIASDGRRVRSPFPLNAIPPARFDPSAVKLLALIPRPTIANSLTSNYNNPYPTDRKTPIPAVKVDHTLSSKMKVSAYWSSTKTAVQYCTPLCG